MKFHLVVLNMCLYPQKKFIELFYSTHLIHKITQAKKTKQKPQLFYKKTKN